MRVCITCRDVNKPGALNLLTLITGPYCGEITILGDIDALQTQHCDLHAASILTWFMTSTMPADCPILVWMLSLNREYTEEEYDECYKLVKECVPHVNFQHNPPDPESFREYPVHYITAHIVRALYSFRTTHDSYVASPNDEASSNPPCQVARLCNAKWKALD
jgi:hypothetical protein